MVNTVTGPVNPSELGITYIHEHLYVKPNELPRYYPYTLDSIEKSTKEVESFVKAGGATIVEMTPLNFGRNTEVLKQIAERTGANVICITGFHKDEHLPKWFDELSDEEVSAVISDEIENGIGYSHVRPGAIKIGSSFNTITDRERRAIDICANVAREHTMPMITHCDKGTMAIEQLRLISAAGMDLSRVCLSHVDIPLDVEYIEQICSTGAYVSFDHVGRDLEGHDNIRIDMLERLVADGFGERICLAGDMGKKDYFSSYGGRPGLSYILTTFKTDCIVRIGERAFSRMVTANPASLFSR